MPTKKKNFTAQELEETALNNRVRKRFGEDIPFKVYDLCKNGLSMRAISDILNIPYEQLKGYKTKPGILGSALRAGLAYRVNENKSFTFRDYIFDQLPEKLQQLWDEIDACALLENPVARVEEILGQHSKGVRQHLFMYAYVHFNFSVNQALRHLGIASNTLYEWKEKDDNFAKLMDMINFHKKNFYEDSLNKLIAEGNQSAIIFANKTLNQDRGFGNTSKVSVSVSGEIHHSLDVVDVESLGIDLDTKRKLLERIREQKALDCNSDIIDAELAE